MKKKNTAKKAKKASTKKIDNNTDKWPERLKHVGSCVIPTPKNMYPFKRINTEKVHGEAYGPQDKYYWLWDKVCPELNRTANIIIENNPTAYNPYMFRLAYYDESDGGYITISQSEDVYSLRNDAVNWFTLRITKMGLALTEIIKNYHP